MLHALLNNNNLIGLFTDHNECRKMLEGLVVNRFVDQKNITIKTFYSNSITPCEYDNDMIEDFSSDSTTDSEHFLKVQSDELDSDTKKKIEEERKNKSEIQHEINKLIKNKEKLEESKRVYDVDIDLYKKFKDIKENNSSFEIPEMFFDKYKLFLELESANKLSWENFHELYKPKQLNTSFSKLFE